MEWIPVEERLPEFAWFVLVGRNKDCVCSVEAQYLDGKFISHRFGELLEFKDPTHWAELPEPPEET